MGIKEEIMCGSEYELDTDVVSSQNIQWQSLKYRKWMRDNAVCMQCNTPLREEKETYTSHHYKPENFTSTGGSVNVRDQFLVPLCLYCHNRFHSLGDVEFMNMNGFTEKDFLESSLVHLVRYCTANNNKELISIIELITAIIASNEADIAELTGEYNEQ